MPILNDELCKQFETLQTLKICVVILLLEYDHILLDFNFITWL